MPLEGTGGERIQWTGQTQCTSNLRSSLRAPAPVESRARTYQASQVHAEDVAGNKTLEQSFEVRIDTVAPIVPLVGR